MYIFISFERGLFANYVIWSVNDKIYEHEPSDNIRVATSDEFKAFFTGCGPQ